MFVQSKLVDFFIRGAIGLLVGVLFAYLLSEISYNYLGNKESISREPQRQEIVIPYGTSRQVADGVYNQSIPTNMVFVEGDILIVKNEDVVDHQIGPLWVPAGTSSVLELNQANNYNYECSFQPSRYMGLDVRPRVTGDTRMQAILAIALPTGLMLAVYSYLVPVRRKEKQIAPGG